MKPDLKMLKIVLSRVIAHYLESHKRLVVPQLGTFIVKQAGESVLFSELLKRDDGVLRELLKAEGRTELEAAGEIDRFVFEVRHAVEAGDSYVMDGLGAFRSGANATILFAYTPQSSSALTADDAPRKPQCDPERIAETVKHAFDSSRMSPSIKMNPDPSLRGLRYGRPHKNTDAYAYVDRPPRRRMDRFVWFAIVAVLIAVAAIAFGYFSGTEEEAPSTEVVAPATQSEQSASQSDQTEKSEQPE